MTVKTYSTQQAGRAIIHLLPRISNENLVRLTHLGQWLTDDEEVLESTIRVRELLQTKGHPAKALFRRVLDYLPPERRIRLFETLFNGAWFKGGKQRDHPLGGIRGPGVGRLLLRRDLRDRTKGPDPDCCQLTGCLKAHVQNLQDVGISI